MRSPHAVAQFSSRVALSTAVRLEVAKTRRLWIWPVAAALVVVGLGLSLPMSRSARAALTAPGDPWPQLLLSTSMAAALVSPVLTAVLASRLTEVEHTGGGWMMAAATGLTPGRLCRAKAVALSGVLAVAVTVQVGAEVLVARLLGASTDLSVPHWLGYSLLLVAVDVVSCAWHVLLAARVENQIVTVGVGFLGSFVALFSLLMPPALTRVVPWGYWALITPARQSGSGADGSLVATYSTPPLGWVIGFLVLTTAGFLAVTTRLDRIER